MKKFWKFTFVCSCRGNRSWFVHECTMFNENNIELASSKCQYYNRTREPRTYYTAIRDCVRTYRNERIERAITNWKIENWKNRLPNWKRDELTKEFDNSELGKELRTALDETESYHSCR